MFDVNEKITSSQNTEEDSLQVFRRAVNNGQTRLALEALVDVIDAIVEILTPDEEEQEQDHVEIKQPAATVEIKEEKLETPAAPVTSTKKKTKETTTDTAE
jgi:hypothetical protein